MTRQRRQARLPILLYHWFAEGDSPPSRSPELGVSPADFRHQLDWLTKNGWTAVGLDQLVGALENQTQLSPKSYALTFDDAYADFFEHALEAVSDLELPVTLFVVADRVGGTNDWDRSRGEPRRRLLDWSQLRQVAAAGIEIGSHSLTHRDLCSLSRTELAKESLDSRRRLEDGLARRIRYFAYPYGRSDSRTRQAIQAAGYEAAAAVMLRSTDLFQSDRFALKRVIVHGTKGLTSFRLRVRFAAPLHRWTIAT